ncbi:E3 ubiquitin-protein ligase RBBP6-like [Hydractinia symbiolongicarpus]|uniref:E3 ubiquitin-protein ligase RBBP6-like n=1 Tax=Hydractinia symbiolongicarpus TaxID=13093 RepID=UPI00254D1B87|nr:E3 ubiquitin-protein ligase RBBP6-like [Hydractinia symbiolongicarpus]
MPGSILINDGRRSASPDRRVTFGNIERYDIMTSNEIKNNIQQRGSNRDVMTVNGNYPMTRLDNRIRKAVMLGFAHTIGDSVAYEEIIDFLLEFDVIVNPKVCNERQITAIVQSSFPKCIVKSSVRHSVVYYNLENRSDEVVKEELVRVTTEPVINPYDSAIAEAQAWIKEEPEGYESDVSDEELTLIEEKKEENNNTTSAVESTDTSSNLSTKNTTKSDMGRLNSDSYNENGTPTKRRSIEIAVTEGHSIEKSMPIARRFYDSGNNDEIKPMREYIVERSTPVQDQMIQRSTPVHDQMIQRSTPVHDQMIQRSTPVHDHMVQRRTPAHDQMMQRSTPVHDQILQRNTPIRDHMVGRNTPIKEQHMQKPTVMRDHVLDRNTIITENISGQNSSTIELSSPVRERAIDVPDSAVIQNKNKREIGVKTGVHKSEKQVNLKRTGSFSNATQSHSVTDMAKKFESKPPDSPSKSSLQRKRSFTRSTDRSFVGSIRDRFRASKSKEENKKGGDEKKDKKAKKGDDERKDTDSVNHNEDSKTKIPSTSITRNTTRTSSVRKNQGLSGSCVDVRSSFRNKTETERGLTRNSSTSASATDIRSSFRNSSTRSSINRSVQRLNKEENSAPKSPYLQRANNAQKPSQTNELRASLRRTSAEKQTNRSELVTRGSINRSSYRAANSSSSSLLPGSNRSSFRDSKTGAVKRTNSRKGLSSKGSSQTSSTSSTPSISRENSKTNIKIPEKKPTKPQSSQEKDLVRIAKAFQKATKEVDTAKDRIEKFMIGIATDDLEEAPNERLKLDDLYNHIRHRMILAKDSIFENHRSNVTVDMSQYFELLFKTLASHFDRVGCEMITNKTTKEHTCFLIHVKLVDYVDDLGDLTAASVEEEDESPRASYV